MVVFHRFFAGVLRFLDQQKFLNRSVQGQLLRLHFYHSHRFLQITNPFPKGPILKKIRLAENTKLQLFTTKNERFNRKWLNLSTLEVTPRFELGNEGFADPCLTTWLCHRMEKGANALLLFHLERATRLELATSTLARWRSTR